MFILRPTDFSAFSPFFSPPFLSIPLSFFSSISCANVPNLICLGRFSYVTIIVCDNYSLRGILTFLISSFFNAFLHWLSFLFFIPSSPSLPSLTPSWLSEFEGTEYEELRCPPSLLVAFPLNSRFLSPLEPVQPPESLQFSPDVCGQQAFMHMHMHSQMQHIGCRWGSTNAHSCTKKRKEAGPEESSCCACRRSQQEDKHEEGERMFLPIPNSVSSQLQRKFAKWFFTNVQKCKPTWAVALLCELMPHEAARIKILPLTKTARNCFWLW